MLQDAHSTKVSAPVVANIGTTVIVPASTNAWIYVHELMGDLANNGTLTIRAGLRQLAYFTLDAGQGMTENDEPGNDNVPRFVCKPGEDFNIIVTGGQFAGTIDYSYRY